MKANLFFNYQDCSNILLYLLLILGLLFITPTSLHSQLKESYVGQVDEAQALSLKKKGGVYVGKSEDSANGGWWVQYRKVMRIERVAYDPNTGKSWYYVYYSQVIPLEHKANHPSSSVSSNGWLWLPYGSQPPWETGTAGRSFTWVLKQNHPIWNPGNQQYDNYTSNSADKVALYSGGLSRHVYRTTANQQLDYEWYFRFIWDKLPPRELLPGQTFIINLSGEASGRLMNYHIGYGVSTNPSGFQVTYDPHPASYNNAVFVGRPGSSGQIIQKNQREFTFRVPDQPRDQLSLTMVLGNWGSIVTYVWEKQAVW